MDRIEADAEQHEVAAHAAGEALIQLTEALESRKQ